MTWTGTGEDVIQCENSKFVALLCASVLVSALVSEGCLEPPFGSDGCPADCKKVLIRLSASQQPCVRPWPASLLARLPTALSRPFCLFSNRLQLVLCCCFFHWFLLRHGLEFAVQPTAKTLATTSVTTLCQNDFQFNSFTGFK